MTLPKITVDDVSVNENTDAMATFVVELSEASDKPVTVEYYTQNFSAQAGRDFVHTTGTLTFAAGELSKQVTVTLANDSYKEGAESFDLFLQNATEADLTDIKATAFIADNDTDVRKDDAGFISPETYEGFGLAWSDEFDGPEMSAAIYNFELGNNNGWGNQELEVYTADNESFEDGKLVIEARLEGSTYTSARITTKGKKEFKYGRIDIRAKLPNTKGIWPALWMLGEDIDAVSWPACGEIDIMEMIGTAPSTTHGTGHWGSDFNNHKSGGSSVNISPEKFADQYHVFSVYWQQNSIHWYLDDQLFSHSHRRRRRGSPGRSTKSTSSSSTSRSAASGPEILTALRFSRSECMWTTCVCFNQTSHFFLSTSPARSSQRYS
ncbi:MAG: family 16 glycosylhydrolase [Bacteroidia bacterium]|nr:family 16 glycosylhydrolase [Bacteroidia bacterium]